MVLLEGILGKSTLSVRCNFDRLAAGLDFNYTLNMHTCTVIRIQVI